MVASTEEIIDKLAEALREPEIKELLMARIGSTEQSRLISACTCCSSSGGGNGAA
jgi:hypothetical protein